MKKKVFRERYRSIPIPKQDEIYKKEDLAKEVGEIAKTKVLKNTRKKKSEKK